MEAYYNKDGDLHIIKINGKSISLTTQELKHFYIISKSIMENENSNDKSTTYYI